MRIKKLAITLISLLWFQIAFCNQIDKEKKETSQGSLSSVQFKKKYSSNLNQKSWSELNNLITLQQTIQKFPFIKHNLEAIRIAQLLKIRGGCQNWLAKILILENQIKVYGEFKNHYRTLPLIKLLKNIQQKVKLPDMYFLIQIQDELTQAKIKPEAHHVCRELPLFMFNKNCSDFLQQTKFLLPDPYIISDNWKKTEQEIQKGKKNIKWQQKIPKAFFRGAASGPHLIDHDVIDQKTDIFRYFHRGAFTLLSYQRPDLVDARLLSYNFPVTERLISQIRRRVGNKYQNGNAFSSQDLLKFKYLLTADGFGAPWNRTPFILLSNSLLMRPYSQKLQWFYDKMIPYIHFIPIKEDLSDLFTKVQWIRSNDELAKQIIKRANFLGQKYLSSEAIMAYTIDTLLKYAQLQNLTLNQKQKQLIKSGKQIDDVLLQYDSLINYIAYYQKGKESQQRNNWSKINVLTSFYETIQRFPYLKQNIKGQKISNILRSCNKNFVKFLVMDNKIYTFGNQKINQLIVSFQQLLQKAIEKLKLVDVYFLIQIQDQFTQVSNPSETHNSCKQLPFFIFKKNCSDSLQQTKFLLPDPYITSDNWVKIKQEIQNAEKNIKWQQKIPKAFFRGTASSPHLSNDNVIDEKTDVFRYFHRGAFTLLSYQRPDLIDARLISNKSPIAQRLINEIKQRIGDKYQNGDAFSSQDLMRFKYLLTADGSVAPWNRTPFILLSNSLLLRPYSQKIQWFQDKMIPYIHFIPIKEDLSDLFGKIQWIRSNDAFSKQIIKRANFLGQKYLSSEAIITYTIDTLLKYAQLQNLTLNQKQKQLIKSGKQIDDVLLGYNSMNNQTLVISLIAGILLTIFLYQVKKNYKNKIISDYELININKNNNENDSIK